MIWELFTFANEKQSVQQPLKKNPKLQNQSGEVYWYCRRHSTYEHPFLSLLQFMWGAHYQAQVFSTVNVT